METPPRMFCQPGSANLYNSSGLPWPAFTSTAGEAFEGGTSGSHFHCVLQLLVDELLHRLEADQFRQRLGDGAENANVSVVVLVNPHAGKTGNAFDDSQLVGLFPAVNVLQQGRCVLQRNDDESTPRFESLMHRLQAVPCPRFRALAERVIEDHGQVHLLRLILRHSGFERLIVVGDDGEALGWNAVTLWRISVAAEGNAHLAFVMRGQNNAAGYVLSQGLLKDPSVYDFDRE